MAYLDSLVQSIIERLESMKPRDPKCRAEQVLDKRVRNRIIETLETLASEELCAAVGADELVNQWYDFVPEYGAEIFPFADLHGSGA